MTDEVKIKMSTNVNKTASGTYTATGLYDSVNALKDLIVKPGELFIMNEKNNGGSFLNGFNNGIAFVAIIGSVIAVAAIALGVPNAHLQFRPSMIFGFA